MSESTSISEQDIAEFLNSNPRFFETHSELLGVMFLPSLHGGGTVSLAERQQLIQRDKIRALESKMAELISYAQENEAISEKIHMLSMQLLAAVDFESLLQVILHTLREDFQIPYVGIRVWANPIDAAHQANSVFEVVDIELSLWADSLVEPYCGSQPGLDFVRWFGENSIPKSFALVALRGNSSFGENKVFGLLAMASDDEKRFYPEMGIVYLIRIGELISASLQRYLA